MPSGAEQSTGRTRPWWLELEVGLLVLLVGAIYFSRLGDLTIRGEESRWARVAREMLDTGDWVVPRQQGAVFADRPPLASWLIALATLAWDSDSPAAVRFPTVLATLLTSVLVYGYSRTFLERGGALAAGACYATMGQVLELGRLAETEATFTFLVAASLLLWHWGYSRGWPAAWTWMAGYSLAALAALAKGPQGPFYFAGAAVLFLVLRRDWRFLFCWPHLAGVLSFAALVGAWQLPFALAVAWPEVKQIWGHHATARFVYSEPLPVIKHLAAYPLEVAACLLPWSILLAALFSRQFQRSIGEARTQVAFLAAAIAVAFAPCWLATHARGRYFMPLYPCFAPLVGLVVERCAAGRPSAPVERLWRGYLAGMAALMLLVAGGVAGASWLGRFDAFPLAQPPLFACVYAFLSLIAAAVAWSARRGGKPWLGEAGVLAVATFLGLTYTGVVTNALIRSSEDTAGHVARLKERLPPGERLVSLGPAHHAFAYHYARPIELYRWPRDRAGVEPRFNYFCYQVAPGIAPPTIAFAWQRIAVIPCDRNRRREPREMMIVGRRFTPEERTQAAADDRPSEARRQ